MEWVKRCEKEFRGFHDNGPCRIGSNWWHGLRRPLDSALQAAVIKVHLVIGNTVNWCVPTICLWYLVMINVELMPLVWYSFCSYTPLHSKPHHFFASFSVADAGEAIYRHEEWMATLCEVGHSWRTAELSIGPAVVWFARSAKVWLFTAPKTWMAPMRLGCAQSCWEVKVLALMDCEKKSQAEELLYLQGKLGQFHKMSPHTVLQLHVPAWHVFGADWFGSSLAGARPVVALNKSINVLPCLTKSEPGVQFLPKGKGHSGYA